MCVEPNEDFHCETLMIYSWSYAHFQIRQQFLADLMAQLFLVLISKGGISAALMLCGPGMLHNTSLLSNSALQCVFFIAAFGHCMLQQVEVIGILPPIIFLLA